ncbi:KilA-N domain-containing protein [Acinetobacter cumulans]|uniref:KilA-N domain-containing protein n=1 Tax=Acinetobacter cumulans TaxID=2136182 RepID=A0A3A8G2V4_9GAMM|nr:KilA-N domain-containing protein [Acinetobacter cumulans]RKG47243.1 KilA-N domain-containing protein [Acinetobacter cumulans]
MSNLTQNFANPNNQPLVIGEFSIRQDEDGRYCLNDLHKASGGLEKHKPTRFIRNKQTQELISEIELDNNQRPNLVFAIKTLHGGPSSGTYVVEDLVYSYAMWISAKFHLMVIRAYRAQVMEWMIGGKQTISPEQAGILYNIVHTRAGENKNLIVQMWSRLKNHFKYSASYRELRAIHFEDAKHYLEVMDLRGNTEKREVKSDKIEVHKNYRDNAHGLALHMIWVNRWWKEFGPAIRALSPRIAGAINDHFTDGVCFAYHFVDKPTVTEINDRVERYSWHLTHTERMALEFKNK